MAMQQAAYPIQFSVDYPDRPLNRLTTAFRVFVAIPILIVLGAVSGGTWQWSDARGTTVVAAGAGGLLFFGPLLMILFRQKYPRWWFDWNLELQRFTNRVGIYLALMDDRYPATDQQQAVHLDYVYPDAARELNRWLPLVKWFLAIPHYIVLLFLWIAAIVVVIIAWFAILFTGRYPRGMSTSCRASSGGASGGRLRVRAGHRQIPAVLACPVDRGSVLGAGFTARGSLGRRAQEPRWLIRAGRLAQRRAPVPGRPREPG
jgi:hypothetical protein